jgi:hypothetical protein
MTRLNYKTWTALLLALCSISFLPARAGGQLYDYEVTIEVVETNELRYKDSPLSPVTEARISYAPADGSNDSDYETITYGNGKAYGLLREGEFVIGEGQGVIIRVEHDDANPIQADFDSAANAIARMFLEVRRSDNIFQYVVVPDDSYSGIVDAMGNEHFQVFTSQPDVPYKVTASILIRDQSGLHSTTVCYAPTSTGSIR